MKGKNRLSMLAVVLLLVFMVWYGLEASITEQNQNVAGGIQNAEITVWYCDESLKDYVESAAQSYSQAYHAKVNVEQISEVSYIEKINEQSVGEEFTGPDVYLVSNDELEMMELAGLTKKVKDKKKHYTTEHYCDTALHAVRYNGAQIAYPVSFETSFLIYNKEYAVLEEQDEEGNDLTKEVIPADFEQIKDFSEKCELQEGVENIFRFDVSDIFYTYFVVGNYLQLGGLDGDNAGVVDIANPQVKACLEAFQEMAQFFAMDVKTINYETVMEEFAQGKTVYTIGKTDALRRIQELVEENGKEISIGVASLPNISEDLNTKALSITTVAVVNGYTRQEEAASDFADYLAYGYVGKLYETTGKYCAKRGESKVESSFHDEIYSQYENSVSLPKLINASNFWVNMEIAFFNIWSGEDVTTQIEKVSDQLTRQLSN